MESSTCIFWAMPKHWKTFREDFLGFPFIEMNRLFTHCEPGFGHAPTYEPGSKLVVLGMAIPPLIGNPYNGYINPYYWVDDHPLLYGNNGSLDPIAHIALYGSFFYLSLSTSNLHWILCCNTGFNTNRHHVIMSACDPYPPINKLSNGKPPICQCISNW